MAEPEIGGHNERPDFPKKNRPNQDVKAPVKRYGFSVYKPLTSQLWWLAGTAQRSRCPCRWYRSSWGNLFHTKEGRYKGRSLDFTVSGNRR